jgi:hypothetical protein
MMLWHLKTKRMILKTRRKYNLQTTQIIIGEMCESGGAEITEPAARMQHTGKEPGRILLSTVLEVLECHSNFLKT